MQSPHHVDIQDLGVAWVVLDVVNGQAWIKPITLLKYTGAGDGMIDVTMLFETELEQVINITVAGDVAFGEDGIRPRVTKFPASRLVGVTKDDRGTIVQE